MASRSVFLALVLSLLTFVAALGQNATISFEEEDGSLLLTDTSAPVQIIVDGADWKGVIKVANDLAMDFGRVTGLNGTVVMTNSSSSAKKSAVQGTIIAGTIGKSALIDGLVSSGKLNVNAIKGQWEAFSSQLLNVQLPGSSKTTKALVIAGADKRGTIYGLYDISEQIGVSPWYWWADVAPKDHTDDEIYAINTVKVQGSPSVKYRGFFLNDEAPAMTGWVNAKYPPAKYGPGYNADLYATIFELLLRLRANYIWPAGADWGQAFFVDDPRNQPLADDMGIVMGTSHTEPFARATKEWNLFGKGAWQWNTNNQSIIPFLRDGAIRAKPFENVLTMGMRGSGDTALGAGIETALLENIVDTQRQLLTDIYGAPNAVPQMWCLYKEVQGFYEAGMRVPDDITLLWADDNWGNLRRTPLPTEYNRTGGAGVYYHFDYVGDPRNYKWINTIQLQRTWEQMRLAYLRHATDIWVVNVGDLKPLEIPIQHFMDLAYNFEQWGPASVPQWLQLWAAQQFDEEHAAATAAVLNQYSRLAGRRKFELVDPSTYSVINYQESDRVLAEWNALSQAAQNIYDDLDDSMQPSFFEMVLHPVLAGTAVYDVHISGAKNRVYAQQWRNSANRYAQHMLDRFNDDHKLTVAYNTLLKGKWAHMMDQTHIGYSFWQQPMRQVTPLVQYVQTLERALTGDMGVTVEGTNASVPGDDQYHPNSANSLTMLPIDPYLGPRYIDVFPVGTNNFTWKISAAPYIQFSQSTGSLSPTSPDVRVNVTVNWGALPNGTTSTTINITSSTDYGAQYSMPQLILPINNTKVPSSFTSGFVESDATISIEAEHFSRITGNSTSGPTYITIPSYGRTLSAVTYSEGYIAQNLTTSSAPALEYDFYTFTPTTAKSPANITLILGTGLNADPTRPLRYSIAVDNQTPQVVTYIQDQTGGQTPVGWGQAVADAAWKSTTNATVTPGKHTLKIWQLEPGVVLQKVVVDLGGVRGSYLGPPESARVGSK